MKLHVLDLFAGCGGLTMGFQNAGFHVVAAVDNWQPAVDVYRYNFTHPMLHLDLADTQSTDALAQFRPDIIIGGPPCQDYSSAGKRDEEGGRADLTLAFASTVQALQPATFVMENVERICKSRRLPIVMELLKQAGYGLTTTVLDASYCGVPQARKRFFMIGIKGGADMALLPYLHENLSDEPMTVRDYFGDSLRTEFYYRHPRNYSRRGIYSIDEPSPTIRGVSRPIPRGYPGHPADAAPLSDAIRPLTTIERAGVQTFPASLIYSPERPV